MTDRNDPLGATRQLTGRLKQAREIDEVCRRFETEWRTGQPLRIEDCLSGAEAQLRDELLFELVAVEIELRRGDGQVPTCDEYLRRFPQDESIVIAAFDEAVSAADSVSPKSDAELPERFGEFRIVREVGRGGMGVVYEAEQESLRRRVALKSLLGRYDTRSPVESRQRFLREARAIARLHHSNIVDVFGDGEHDGVPYFAMRFIDGSGLDQVIASIREMIDSRCVTDSTEQSTAEQTSDDTEGRRQPVGGSTTGPAGSGQPQAGEPVTPAASGGSRDTTEPSTATADSIPDWSTGDNRRGSTEFRPPVKSAERADLAAKIGRSIASALQYAHDSGVLHWDVKPSNILIDGSGTAWLTDFGLAQLSESETVVGLTLDGSVMGTLRYLPPESLAGEVGASGDQYALGLTLFELIALRPAFDRQERAGLLRDIEQCARPALDTIAPDTPRDLVTIIHKAIDREPAARYASVGELGDDLQRFLDDEPIRARRISKLEQLSRWRRRNRGLAASLSTVAVLLIVVAVGSALAAGYFSSLNTKLNSTVEELTTTAAELTTKTNDLTIRTGELTVARNQAQNVAAENLKLAESAKAARDRAEDTVYFSRIALADQAWQSSDVTVARALLEKCRPQPGGRDRRDWEWRYLDGLCDANVIHFSQATIHRSDYIYDVAFSPDGRWLATGSSVPWTSDSSSDLAVWDTRDYRLVNVVETPIPDPKRVRFSRDSRVVALLDKQGAVAHAVDAGLTEVIPLDQVEAADFRDSESLVAEFDPDVADGHSVVLRNPQTGEAVRTLALPGSVQGVTLSGDGRWAGTAGDDTAVRVWNLDSGNLTHILRGHDVSVFAAAFSSDGHQLASVSRDGIRIWDLTRAQQQLTLRVPHTHFPGERLVDFAFSHSGDELICATAEDDAIRIASARVATGERVHFTDHVHLTLLPGQFRAFAFCPASRQFVAPLRSNPVEAVACDLDSGRILHTLTDRGGYIIDAEFTRDGRLIATSSNHMTPVRLWDARTGRLLKALAPRVDATEGGDPTRTPLLSFSQSGDRLACCYQLADGIHIWDTDSGELVCQLPVELPEPISDCSFSADGSQLAVRYSSKETVTVFDLRENREPLTLTGIERADARIEFSPSGHRLATSGRIGLVYVWDTDTGELILRLKPSAAGRANYGFTPMIHWSPNGRYLAANNWRGEINVWETPDPDESQADRLAIAETRSTLWFIEQARIAFDGGDRAEALRQAEKVWHRTDLSPATQIERGFLWARLGEWEPAVADLYPPVPHSVRFRQLVSEHIDQSEELITKAATLRPDIPELKLELANQAERAGRQIEADQLRRQALVLLEQELTERPDDTFVARHLADLIRKERANRWLPLRIQSAESTEAATLTLRDDGSIMASGNNVPGDVYTITARCDADQVAAIRLDVIPDPSLPNEGSGRHPSGNFQLAEIQLLSMTSDGRLSDEPHVFSDAMASYQYPAEDVNVLGTIRPDDSRVWHIWSRWRLPHHAIFTLEQPLAVTPDQSFVIRLRHDNSTELNLGRFRLSVCATPFVIKDMKESELLSTDNLPPFLVLAAARLSAGQNDKALAALQHVPKSEHPTETAFRLLLLAQLQSLMKNDEEAAKSCERLVSWLNLNTLPEALESWTRRVLINSGGLSPEAAASVLERSKLNGEQH